jgi:hypothetical protein
MQKMEFLKEPEMFSKIPEQTNFYTFEKNVPSVILSSE